MEKKYYYKAMNKNKNFWREFQCKVGEIYTIESKELSLRSGKVFNFCEKLEDTIKYYSKLTNRHFLIEVLGDIVTEGNISASNKIKIVREISREEIEEHIQDKVSFNAKRFLALYTTKVEMLETLSKDKHWAVRNAVAQNPNTPVHILEYIVKSEKYLDRGAVAINPNTPIYILEKLAKDEHISVRFAVASNPNTPVYILEELAKDKYSEVRKAVAENLNSPVYLLEKLAKDEDKEVIGEVAGNVNTPIYILEELFVDESWAVRFGLARNSNTSVYILEELVKDEDRIIKNIAQARLKEITQ